MNFLNELRKRDKMRGLPSILSLFRNEFNKLNNIGALKKIVSEYDQEIPQSQTADNPVAPRGRAAQLSRELALKFL